MPIRWNQENRLRHSRSSPPMTKEQKNAAGSRLMTSVVFISLRDEATDDRRFPRSDDRPERERDIDADDDRDDGEKRRFYFGARQAESPRGPVADGSDGGVGDFGQRQKFGTGEKAEDHREQSANGGDEIKQDHISAGRTDDGLKKISSASLRR